MASLSPGTKTVSAAASTFRGFPVQFGTIAGSSRAAFSSPPPPAGGGAQLRGADLIRSDPNRFNPTIGGAIRSGSRGARAPVVVDSGTGGGGGPRVNVGGGLVAGGAGGLTGGGLPGLPTGGGLNPCINILGRTICGSDILDRLTGGGSDSDNEPGARASCPPGFRVDSKTGTCVKEGAEGAIERMLPGGDTGVLGDQFGPAVIGGFGVPAIVPAQVGTRARADGSVGPILQCPRGAILGKDDLCYQKGSIPVSFRKWRPAAKPPMSAADARALRRIKTLQGKAKKLATSAGLTCRTRR